MVLLTGCVIFILHDEAMETFDEPQRYRSFNRTRRSSVSTITTKRKRKASKHFRVVSTVSCFVTSTPPCGPFSHLFLHLHFPAQLRGAQKYREVEYNGFCEESNSHTKIFNYNTNKKEWPEIEVPTPPRFIWIPSMTGKHRGNYDSIQSARALVFVSSGVCLLETASRCIELPCFNLFSMGFVHKSSWWKIMCVAIGGRP